MAEDDHTERSDTPKGGRKRIVRTAAFLAAILLVLPVLWTICTRESLTPQQRLAALQAELAIPDEQNAALIYNQVLNDYDEVAFFFDSADFAIELQLRTRPWSSKDYPELAQWLQERQDAMAILIEAGKKKESRFLLGLPAGDPPRMRRMRMAKRWMFLLLCSANNDIAEGRTDQALKKWTATLQIANHFRQQPVIVDLVVGNAIEACALQNIQRFVAEDQAALTELDIIDSELKSLENNSSVDWSMMRQVEMLFQEHEVRQVGFGRGFRLIVQYREQDIFAYIERLNLRLLSERHGTRISIALRRYKAKNGVLPETLDQAHSFASEEIFVDPQNGGPFAYKPTGEGFRLYSKGRNNVDERGESNAWWSESGGDDWPIWPRKGYANGKEDKDDDQH